MNDAPLAITAEALVQARRAARPIDALDAHAWPSDLAGAYRLQRSVAEALGAMAGWKVSALTPAQQQAMDVPGPVAAPLLAPWTQASPAVFALPDFCHVLLECEFAFELAHDLPTRAEPYTRAEVEAAIGALVPVVEVCDSRLPPHSPTLAQLADAFNNGAFVTGTPTRDWRGVDAANHETTLSSVAPDGQRATLARGTGRAVLEGDLVGALMAMANLQPQAYGGLRAGQIVTTGSCIVPQPVTAAGDFEADFGHLGTVRLRFDSARP